MKRFWSRVRIGLLLFSIGQSLWDWFTPITPLKVIEVVGLVIAFGIASFMLMLHNAVKSG